MKFDEWKQTIKKDNFKLYPMSCATQAWNESHKQTEAKTIERVIEILKENQCCYNDIVCRECQYVNKYVKQIKKEFTHKE